ncbi:probable phosphoglycerate mutase [Rhizobium sp. RU20A]|uniref:histidine phosphatase family protein n=1 Tax=Rhizobium sp. RU20A TaxID=1907412 RepID=UPI000955D1BC|nr:histidine phosphatase family protein [Rhizobium sp. RU20A]SIR09722.1 probable phosphoglycerate mutase [Rhizobium sp. RU20A]
MLVYMVRHGQTDWNAEGRLQGQKDIALNSVGERQAAANGRALKALIGATIEDYDFVSSPLTRCRQTMEAIRGELGLARDGYRLDERLREVSFGDWEGHTLTEIEERHPDAIAAREASKWDFIPPGDAAESYEILSWRVAAWLSTVDRPTVCIAHGGVIRSVFRIKSLMSGADAAVAPIPQDRILRIGESSADWV